MTLFSSAGDIGRWFFWGPFRGTISPERRRQLRLLRSFWRLQYFASRSSHAVMSEELSRSFLNCNPQELIPKSYKRAWQIHLEELLLSKLNKDNIDTYIQVDGLHHLEGALENNNGVLLLYPHAGPVMLMMAWLAYHDYPYVQYAARGLPPPDMAEAHPELLASNWFRERTRSAREAAEDTLPVDFVTLENSVRPLMRALGKNKIVAIAFDGRIGQRWHPMPFLNRTALLSSGPYRLAQRCGATILPTFCWVDENGKSRVSFLQPLPEAEQWETHANALIQSITPLLEEHPEEYALWLLHCRMRAGIDDHPLFTDHAPNNRYKKWL